MTAMTPGHWTLDASHSEIGFTVRHAGISRVRGSFDMVDGSAEIAEDFTQSKIEGTALTASINTKDENRDNHLRGEDFFDVENHPKISFNVTEIKDWDGEEFTMIGDMTIRGTTKPVEFKGEFTGQAVDPFGATRAGFEAKTRISRKEFGLTWNAALEAGGVLVGDRVNIEIDAAFVRNDEEAAN